MVEIEGALIAKAAVLALSADEGLADNALHVEVLAHHIFKADPLFCSCLAFLNQGIACVRNRRFIGEPNCKQGQYNVENLDSRAHS